jgi:hypothetical protein
LRFWPGHIAEKSPEGHGACDRLNQDQGLAETRGTRLEVPFPRKCQHSNTNNGGKLHQ